MQMVKFYRSDASATSSRSASPIRKDCFTESASLNDCKALCIYLCEDHPLQRILESQRSFSSQPSPDAVPPGQPSPMVTRLAGHAQNDSVCVTPKETSAEALPVPKQNGSTLVVVTPPESAMPPVPVTCQRQPSPPKEKETLEPCTPARSEKPSTAAGTQKPSVPSTPAGSQKPSVPSTPTGSQKPSVPSTPTGSQKPSVPSTPPPLEKPKQAVSPSQVVDSDDEKEYNNYKKHYNRMEAKIRRMCEPKSTSGKIEADSKLVAQWKEKGHSRTQLVKLMMEADGAKDGQRDLYNEVICKPSINPIKRRSGINPLNSIYITLITL